ncbi:energy transducer TonB [Sphingomicrobium sp. XHP0239]|uniref:energy transducer TonB n=1 Tax=Sphingomicrobium maritimum TaxID=3133972 RepID=UPI0031CCA265
MLSYAPRPKQKISPTAIGAVVGIHAAAFAAVLLVKPDLVTIVKPEPTRTYDLPLPEPPEPEPREVEPAPETPTEPPLNYTVPETIVDVPRPSSPPAPRFQSLDPVPINPATVPLGPVTPNVAPPAPTPPVPPAPVSASLLTSGSDLRPPYPAALQRQGKEAALRLRLDVDARGRVTSVTLLNEADPRFFRAAREHVMKVWRYTPATRGGTPVASTQTVTLRFQLTD